MPNLVERKVGTDRGGTPFVVGVRGGEVSVGLCCLSLLSVVVVAAVLPVELTIVLFFFVLFV